MTLALSEQLVGMSEQCSDTPPDSGLRISLTVKKRDIADSHVYGEWQTLSARETHVSERSDVPTTPRTFRHANQQHIQENQ